MSAYPIEPGAKESTTSLEAALTTAKTVLVVRRQVLDALRAKEGTADQIAERLGIDRLSVRPRFSELNKLGLIEKSGRREKNESGSTAHVWRVKTAATQPAATDLGAAYRAAKGIE